MPFNPKSVTVTLPANAVPADEPAITSLNIGVVQPKQVTFESITTCGNAWTAGELRFYTTEDSYISYAAAVHPFKVRVLNAKRNVVGELSFDSAAFNKLNPGDALRSDLESAAYNGNKVVLQVVFTKIQNGRADLEIKFDLHLTH